jgi:hypothetical protein
MFPQESAARSKSAVAADWLLLCVERRIARGCHARILEASKTCPHIALVNKTIYSLQSKCLSGALVAMREKARLTQRQLAEKLRREHSLIGRLELGERRLDVVEFFWICKACAANPEEVAARLMRDLEQIQSRHET